MKEATDQARSERLASSAAARRYRAYFPDLELICPDDKSAAKA